MTRGFTTAPDPIRWDYYAASLVQPLDGDLVASELAGCLSTWTRTGQPRQGYRHAVDLVQGERRVAVVMWGGVHETAHVQASGESSNLVATSIRERWVHRISRVDACVDWDDAGAWDAVCGAGLDLARRRNLRKEQAGDWLDPHGGPGQGRTLYIGARSSSVRCRLYEKGRQLPEAGRPDWVRAELQVRPQKAAKAALAALQPREVWGSAEWSQELLTALTGDEVPPARVVQWREPDFDRSYRAMLRQYGRTLEHLAVANGGWPNVGEVLQLDLAKMAGGGLDV